MVLAEDEHRSARGLATAGDAVMADHHDTVLRLQYCTVKSVVLGLAFSNRP